MSWIEDQLDDILASAVAELEACGGDPLCFAAIIPGDAPVDVLCDDGPCGQVTLRLITAYRTSTFPLPSDPAEACSKPMAYQIEIRAMRCFEAVKDHGGGATPGESRDATFQQIADMEAMYRAIKCGSSDRITAVESYTPEGPQGNYVGGSWTFLIAEND
jgi:hypothetical protein